MWTASPPARNSFGRRLSGTDSGSRHARLNGLRALRHLWRKRADFRPRFLRQIDYRSDDNPDDSYVPNYAHNTALRVSFCLFRGCAWSWQCGGQGPLTVRGSPGSRQRRAVTSRRNRPVATRHRRRVVVDVPTVIAGERCGVGRKHCCVVVDRLHVFIGVVVAVGRVTTSQSGWRPIAR
jgi:hypothetical protein